MPAVKKQEEDRKFDWLPRIYQASQTAGLWDKTWKLIKRLWGRVRIEKVDIALKVSLGDDYYTGTVAGMMIPLCLFINRQFATAINLQPAFEEDLLIEGHLNADTQVLPGQIIIPCLAFIFSSPFRHARNIYNRDL
jgi:hypothetical protein